MCIIDAVICQVRKTQGERAKIQDRAGAVQWVAPASASGKRHQRKSLQRPPLRH